MVVQRSCGTGRETIYLEISRYVFASEGCHVVYFNGCRSVSTTFKAVRLDGLSVRDQVPAVRSQPPHPLVVLWHERPDNGRVHAVVFPWTNKPSFLPSNLQSGFKSVPKTRNVTAYRTPYRRSTLIWEDLDLKKVISHLSVILPTGPEPGIFPFLLFFTCLSYDPKLSANLLL